MTYEYIYEIVNKVNGKAYIGQTRQALLGHPSNKRRMVTDSDGFIYDSLLTAAKSLKVNQLLISYRIKTGSGGHDGLRFYYFN